MVRGRTRVGLKDDITRGVLDAQRDCVGNGLICRRVNNHNRLLRWIRIPTPPGDRDQHHVAFGTVNDHYCAMVAPRPTRIACRQIRFPVAGFEGHPVDDVGDFGSVVQVTRTGLSTAGREYSRSSHQESTSHQILHVQNSVA